MAGSRVRSRGLIALLVVTACGALLFAGCGSGPVAVDVDRPLLISELERVRGNFEVPADGVLSDEMVEDYVELCELTRKKLLAQGDGRYLDPRWLGGNQKRRRKRDRLIHIATMQAQLEVGMVDEKLRWVETAVAKALAGGDGTGVGAGVGTGVGAAAGTEADTASDTAAGSSAMTTAAMALVARQANATLVARYRQRLKAARAGFE